MIDIYLQKAKELGEMVLAAETSLRLADAKAAFEGGTGGEAEYLAALRDYEQFVSAVLDMVTMTIYGKEGNGSCGGCCGRR